MKTFMKNGKEMAKIHFLPPALEHTSKEVEDSVHSIVLQLIAAGRIERERFFAGQPCALQMGTGFICKFPMKRKGHRESVELA